MALIEKLTQEQLAQEQLCPQGRKHFMRVAIEQMQAGEALRISHEAFSWKGKTPRLFCKQIERKSNKHFKVYNAVKGDGWVVERVK